MQIQEESEDLPEMQLSPFYLEGSTPPSIHDIAPAKNKLERSLGLALP